MSMVHPSYIMVMVKLSWQLGLVVSFPTWIIGKPADLRTSDWFLVQSVYETVR